MPTNLRMMEATYDDYQTSAFGKGLTGGYGKTPVAHLATRELVFDVLLNTTNTDSAVMVAMGQVGLFRLGRWNNGTAFARYGTLGNETTLSSAVNMNGGGDFHLRLDLLSGGKLFVNGVLVASSTDLVTDKAALLADSYLSVGKWSETYNADWLDGSVGYAAVFTTAQNAGNFTPPAVPLVGDETGLLHVWQLDDNGSDTVGDIEPDLTVNCNDASIYYSPMNWLLSSTKSMSQYCGAYFKTMFRSTYCRLVFKVADPTATQPYLRIVVDGVTSQRVQLSELIEVTLPTTESNLHSLEVYIDATDPLGRFNNPPTGVAQFLYVELDATGTTKAAPVFPKKVVLYGDSIGEGVLARGNSPAETEVDSSAYEAFPRYLGNLLRAEYGVMAWSGQGYQSPAGSVPDLEETWDLMWTGQARDFSSGASIDYVIMEVGTNDLSANIVPNGLLVINGLLTQLPNAVIYLVRPFDGTAQAANLQTIQSTCNEPERVFYMDTDGFFDDADSVDELHPYSAASLGIANNIAEAVLNPPNVTSVNLTATGIPDGTYRTQLFYKNLTRAQSNAFFDGDVTYTSNNGVATFGDVAGREVIGNVIGNGDPLLQGCALKGVTS